MIKIEKVGDLYAAIATPPDVRSEWSTEAPLSIQDLISELRNRGARQTDIGDAFYAADPNWISD